MVPALILKAPPGSTSNPKKSNQVHRTPEESRQQPDFSTVRRRSAHGVHSATLMKSTNQRSPKIFLAQVDSRIQMAHSPRIRDPHGSKSEQLMHCVHQIRPGSLPECSAMKKTTVGAKALAIIMQSFIHRASDLYILAIWSPQIIQPLTAQFSQSVASSWYSSNTNPIIPIAAAILIG